MAKTDVRVGVHEIYTLLRNRLLGKLPVDSCQQNVVPGTDRDVRRRPRDGSDKPFVNSKCWQNLVRA